MKEYVEPEIVMYQFLPTKSVAALNVSDTDGGNGWGNLT